MFFEFLFIPLVIGAMLLHTGIKTWRTNEERRWLIRGFAVLFTTFGVGLLVLTAVGFADWL
jgi:CHASE2 domain-containing sensor protein